MKTLAGIHVVCFSFWDYETFDLTPGGNAIIGPNGAGKTTLVDAVQIAMLGAHGKHVKFNAQSVQKDERSLRNYALGTMRSGEGDSEVVTRKRTEALSYITLVFKDEQTGECVSAGLCLYSTIAEKNHRVLGMYVLPGVKLELEHHLEKTDDGMQPLDWPVFHAQIRALATKAQRQPTITDKPETYVDELLHSIQDSKRHIDRHRFMKSFSHSINLKHVSSVGEFLRGYLVEATPIDKQGTLLHIKTLRSLVAQIEDVKKQIVRLEDIEKKMNSVLRYHQNAAIANAVRSQFQAEDADRDVAARMAAIEALEVQTAKASEALELRRKTEKELLEAYESMRQAVSKDPESVDPDAAANLLRALRTNANEKRRNAEVYEHAMRAALSSVGPAILGRTFQNSAEVHRLSASWCERASKGMLPNSQQFAEGLGLLGKISAEMSEVSRLDTLAIGEAKIRVEAAKQKLNAADRGIKVRDEAVARTMSLFADRGIDNYTVASVVTVSNIQWQEAVESYLGKNRMALIVEKGKEREAVRTLRESGLREVTVVQPVHLADQIGRPRAKDLVSSLFQSHDEVAIAYLSRLFGTTRMVETEEELERHSRAMTKDGMLSANGGTRGMRMLSPNEWLLGVQVSSTDKSEFREELQRAAEAVSAANRRAELSKEADEAIRSAIKNCTKHDFEMALTLLASADGEVQAAKDPVELVVSDRLINLRNMAQEARDRYIDEQDKIRQAGAELAAMGRDLVNQKADLITAQTRFTELDAARVTAEGSEYLDTERSIRQYQAFSERVERGELAEVVASLTRDHNYNANQIPGAQTGAMTAFVEYINEYSISLGEERSDWKLASAWTSKHARKLRDSTLVEYEQLAMEARGAAEAAFQSDVKYRIREALQRVGQEINDLNRILNTCPPFTGGEKYKFIASVAPAHRDLYDLIVKQNGPGETASLLGDGEVQNRLISLMDACEIGADKQNNPLEDYRLFFNFDLEILVNGRVEDYLSKRMGVASNGEHRVPFYVIAGAALATAYRIKPGQPQVGSGVMILDEAFYGMDAQNTVVTAEFLQSIGLQLLMAAPDTDVAKLLPTLDSYYELTRFSGDVFIDRIVVKEAAKSLLMSDIPERNPHLIEAAIQQLSLVPN